MPTHMQITPKGERRKKALNIEREKCLFGCQKYILGFISTF
jgi:hypothetical protein